MESNITEPKRNDRDRNIEIIVIGECSVFRNNEQKYISLGREVFLKKKKIWNRLTNQKQVWKLDLSVEK